MSYQEEEKSRLRRQASKQAIALAMEGRWQEVVAANKALLESFPDDVDAFNRLGRAYLELGEYALSKEAYEKALQLDPYNNIAQKNINRLSRLSEGVTTTEGGIRKVEPQQFIKEVGKAGVVNLYRLAPPDVLAKAVAGASVNLKISGPSLVVENDQGEYLGTVEPKHGLRLLKLIEGGNKYSAAIVGSSEASVTVIIRETYQDPSQSGKLSFPPKEVEPHWPHVDRMLRRELEYEESLPGEPSYTIVGGEEGEETELLLEETEGEEEEEAEE
jgi:tetratricopeptide (TPR) repeat protein